MPTECVNPELLLKAAEMAFPAVKWKLWQSMATGRVFPVDAENGEVYFAADDYGGDAWALNNALRDSGWTFSAMANGKYSAFTTDYPIKVERDESPVLLLYRCISSQFNIPLEV